MLAISLAPASARAAWQPEGTPLSPQPPDYLTQYSLRWMTPDATDGAYVVWSKEVRYNVDDGEWSFVVQRVDDLGNRPAPWGVNGSTIEWWPTGPGASTWGQQSFALFPDGAGGASHALEVSSYTGGEPHSNLHLHYIAPNGTVTADGWFTGTAPNGTAAVVRAFAGDGAGGFLQIAIAQTFAPCCDPHPPAPLYAQKISSPGTTDWAVYLNDPGNSSGGLSVLSDGAGGGYFSWIDTRQAGDPDVYVQHLDATGNPADGWPAGGLIVCDFPGPQFDTHLAPSGDGGVFVVWRDERDGNSRIFASRVHEQGGIGPGIPAEGRQIPAVGASDAFVNLAWDGQDGCFLVTEGTDGIGHLHRLDAALEPRAGWPAVGIALHDQPAGYGDVGLAADGSGGAYVSYRNGFGNVPPQGLYAQHFAANGTVAPGWDPAGYRLSGTGARSILVRSGAGAIVAWDDFRPTWRGVYAQRIVTDGPVAVQMALVSADASGGRASLHWYAPDGANLAVTVERRTEASGWSRLAERSADPSGHVRYEDEAVEPGARYAYRLAWTESDGAHTTAESWVEIPARLVLAIEAPRPNPSANLVSLAVSLPAAAPARIDVLDLAGRRVASLDLALGAGRHVVALPGAASLAAGVYVVQLTQAGDVRRTRLLRVN